MTLDMAMVTFDCTDPDALAAWWADAIGGELNALAPGEFVMVIRPNGPPLGFQRVPDPTPGKNKVHLDFHTSDKEGEVARLVAAGARELGRNSFGPEFEWVVLADPEGNAFCVAGD
ncbi:glyoxalase [Mycobacterium antarcticum]|uniref:VOC family protein n=1 Tax=unclassified Mycolicibacterium TaxID=2636767 RepID=UPI00239CF0F6|nr:MULTISPECIES: VOC family protein [unclassified Mycolicibacterium]BDX30255.1 glyoxalase [Mycolicibacterium sp. TUM20985]GLP73714.1 glyoxalase [Mycolicibacterium sp. TUM20983]GLP79391.1 glyoxalase [Mycolicibacterium sp. TUM20984]